MKTVGADTAAQLETVELFTSHEGLLLEYEQSLTRYLHHPGVRPPSNEDDNGKGWYNTSAHFLWIGDRTRQLDGAHVEYFRGLENPIGIKVGPSMKGDELVRLLDIVNPKKEIGKVTLITRYGEGKVEDMLGPHIDAVKGSGHVVVWQCDPMHGYVLQENGWLLSPLSPSLTPTVQKHSLYIHRHQDATVLIYSLRSLRRAAHPQSPRFLPRRRTSGTYRRCRNGVCRGSRVFDGR
jgi:hypothetical protein